MAIPGFVKNHKLATALTLVIVPAAFTLIDDIERWLGPKVARAFMAAPHPHETALPSKPRVAGS